MRVEDLQKKLDARFGEGLTVRREDRTIIVSGEMDNWHDIVTACSMCVSREKGVHVVNDIHLAGVEMPKMRMPGIHDQAIDGKHPDVLIIGGGMAGLLCARMLQNAVFQAAVLPEN